MITKKNDKAANILHILALIVFVIGLLFLPVITQAQSMNSTQDPIEDHTGFQARVSKNLGISEETFAVCIERSKPGSTWDYQEYQQQQQYNELYPDTIKAKYQNKEKSITLLQCLREKLPDLTQKQLNQAMK